MLLGLPIVATMLAVLIGSATAAAESIPSICSQQVSGAKRIDCYPAVANFPNATEEACLAQGCCWKLLDNGGIPCAFDARETPKDELCASVPSASQVECRNPRYFKALNDKSTCHDVGCCFDEERELCFQPFFEGYELLTLDEGEDGWRGTLALKRFARGPFDNDVPLLLLHVIRETKHRVRVRITDPAFPRYEVPDLLAPVKQDEDAASDGESSPAYKVHFTENPFGIAVTLRDTGEVLFNSTPPLENKQSFNGLVFENQFLEISTQLQHGNGEDEESSPVLYGLGERVAPLKLNADDQGDHYPMFSRDQPADTPHTREGGDNLYGVHPFYMQLRDSGRAHGVFLLSSDAMEVVTQRDALTYRTTGGVLDLFIFTGPTPKDVISQYANLVGKPEMPPYWALGYHLGQWGIKSVDDSLALATRMRDQGVPLEALWHDIDYMDDRKSFTLDETHFPAKDVKGMVDDLHFHNQHFVAIHTPAISTDSGGQEDDQDEDGQYEDVSEDTSPFLSLSVSTSSNPTRFRHEELLNRAKEMNVLIKGVQGEPFAEKYLWSGWSAFVDFFHPNASAFWYEQLAAFHDELVPFDGLWLDMNEPSSSCDFAFADDANACPAHAAAALQRRLRSNRRAKREDEITFESAGAAADKDGGAGFLRSSDIAFPFDPYRQPFAPGQNTQSRGGHGNLNSATLPMASLHHGSLHYNLHSLYGHAAAKTTRQALSRVLKKRSVLLSRSTFSGSGQYTGHWLGSNAATWENLQLSIAGVLQMNLQGIPLVGPNVCGYEQDASKELCVRWHQTASFFPLMRNHARKHTLGQAPVDFDTEAVTIIRDTLLRRYRYLPYMYTLFYNAHKAGTPVARPLVYEFPGDKAAQNIEHQYLLGAALMVSPVVHQGAISKQVHFPNATWYDAENGKHVIDSQSGSDKETSERTVNLLTPLHKMQLHVRGGYIVATQQPATTTTVSRRGGFTLLVALENNVHDHHSYALGELFVDDGDSLDSIDDKRYSHIQFGAFQNASDRFDFRSSVGVCGYDGPEMHVDLQEIKVYGLAQGFRANSSLHAKILVGDRSKEQEQDVRVEYFANAKTLVLSGLNVPIGQDFHVQVSAKPGEPDHAPGDAHDAGTGSQKQTKPTEKKPYSMLAIIGTVVSVLFLLGICVIYILQRCRNAGYNPIA